MENDQRQKYRTVLKSSSLIGGAAFFNIAIGLIRTKFISVFLGPSGIGLVNMYSAILTPISTLADLGLSFGGVREIADANGKNDQEKIYRIAKVLGKLTLLSGMIGFLITAIFSKQISSLTFNDYSHALPISFLGLTIVLQNITSKQNCVLQGLRRILDISKISVLSGIFGTLFAIPCFIVLGLDGIVPSFVVSSFVSFLISWWFTRQVVMFEKDVGFAELAIEANKLLRFGLPVMLTYLLTALIGYLIRLIIKNSFGLNGLGIWSAAMSFSMVLVNFVLSAMVKEYFPRLSSISSDNIALSREVNIQSEIALLLTAPLLVVTVLFAPLGIELLYSGKFNDAIPVLRWSVFGVLGMVISWPMGNILPAMGKTSDFFLIELLFNSVHIGLVYFCCVKWGLDGTGIAFALNYLVYSIAIVIIAYYYAQAYYSLNNLKLMFCIIMLLFGANFFYFIENQIVYYVFSMLFFFAVTFWALRRISKLTETSFDNILTRLGFRKKF